LKNWLGCRDQLLIFGSFFFASHYNNPGKIKGLIWGSNSKDRDRKNLDRLRQQIGAIKNILAHHKKTGYYFAQ
jgi:hypothetical protein